MSYQYDDVGGMVMDLYGRVDKLRFIWVVGFTKIYGT